MAKVEISMMDIAHYIGFLGAYKYEDDELTISQHGDKLFLSFPYTQEMQLHRESDDLFFVQEGSDAVKLIKSQDHGYQVHIISSSKETVYTNVDSVLSLKP